MNRITWAGLAATILVACSARAATGWETDFGKASTNASKTGMYMLLDFSGSDWCGWCIRLEEEVFSKPEFKKFAKENLVCVLLDFPRRKHQSKKLKEQNAQLAEKFGIRGYPTVLVLSPDGELVGRTGYQPGGPQKYVEHLKAMIDDHKSRQPAKTDAKPGATPKPDAP